MDIRKYNQYGDKYHVQNIFLLTLYHIEHFINNTIVHLIKNKKYN